MKKLTKEEIDKLSSEEFEEYLKQVHLENTLTVGQIIKHLEDNFKPTDKLCYLDVISGYKMNYEYVNKEWLGKNMFVYVKDRKQQLVENEKSFSQEGADEMFPYVGNEDMIML